MFIKIILSVLAVEMTHTHTHTHTHILVFMSKCVFAIHGGNGLYTFIKDFELKLLLNYVGMYVKFIDTSW